MKHKYTERLTTLIENSADKKWIRILFRWLTDYDFKTFFNASGSILTAAAFALYNGFLGIRHSSFWHGSICVYYLLLLIIRGGILEAERLVAGGRDEKLRGGMYLAGSVLLLVLNLCMIGPIIIMVRQEKPVDMTLTPAIIMAAYAFSKITIASVNLVKRKQSGNCLVKLLRSISFIDALMSIVTLQNTLIMVTTTGDRRTMLPLTAVSSGLIWFGTVVLAVAGLVKGFKRGS